MLGGKTMQERNLTIYFTSDLHSYIYTTDYRSQEEKDLGLFKCLLVDIF